MSRPLLTWGSTFARFRPGSTRLAGPVTVRVEDWSRPQPGHAPMFDHPWLERLSLAHPAVPVAVYLPVGAWLMWRAWNGGIAPGRMAVAYLAGLLTWSLFEYVAHRGPFHHTPTTPAQVAYGYLVHGVHHAYPDDSRRWVMPLAATAPIAAALYGLFVLALGPMAPPVFAGFIHGYLAYDLLHYFIHRGRMPTRIGRYLRQYHLAHHYKSPDRHFGVSSPLWDFVFRTR